MGAATEGEEAALSFCFLGLNRFCGFAEPLAVLGSTLLLLGTTAAWKIGDFCVSSEATRIVSAQWPPIRQEPRSAGCGLVIPQLGPEWTSRGWPLNEP